MSLDAWLARIERLHPSEIELGLDRVAGVAEALGVSRATCPVITVAGTNGKGSCIALASALAQSAGLQVGVYTSPHLHHFNERVRINGVMASDSDLERAFEQVDAARADTPLTYFEFTTLAALWLLRQHQPALDLLLLEVGLGGRLDAVNVVDADVAVVTSIGLDHTDWLGDTREAICAEKWGVGRPGRPLVFADPAPPANVASLVSTSGVRLLAASEAFAADATGVRWRGRRGADCRASVDAVPLGRDNLATALQALACAGVTPAGADIAGVARHCHVPGRHQQVQLAGVTWVFDVGHNREALWRFSEQLEAGEGTTVAICGMLADKPAATALSAFVGRVSQWHLCTLEGSRGQSASELKKALPGGERAICHATPAAAVAAVRDAGPAVERVLVFGSFLMLDAVARALGIDLFRVAPAAMDDSAGS
ncbi:MAG: Mur ligase family protein [Alcanivoracaceae bacterium]|nr:Mur ligase family protein [Alcanivoracaceae bacterium]